MSESTGTRGQVKLDAQYVDRLRVEAGMTREALGQQAGLSTGTVARVFAGRPVGVRTAVRVAKALGVAVVRILPEDNRTAAANTIDEFPPDEVLAERIHTSIQELNQALLLKSVRELRGTAGGPALDQITRAVEAHKPRDNPKGRDRILRLVERIGPAAASKLAVELRQAVDDAAQAAGASPGGEAKPGEPPADA